jgi:hypothetical protein
MNKVDNTTFPAIIIQLQYVNPIWTNRTWAALWVSYARITLVSFYWALDYMKTQKAKFSADHSIAIEEQCHREWIKTEEAAWFIRVSSKRQNWKTYLCNYDETKGWTWRRIITMPAWIGETCKTLVQFRILRDRVRPVINFNILWIEIRFWPKSSACHSPEMHKLMEWRLN